MKLKKTKTEWVDAITDFFVDYLPKTAFAMVGAYVIVMGMLFILINEQAPIDFLGETDINSFARNMLSVDSQSQLFLAIGLAVVVIDIVRLAFNMGKEKFPFTLRQAENEIFAIIFLEIVVACIGMSIDFILAVIVIDATFELAYAIFNGIVAAKEAKENENTERREDNEHDI